MPGFPMFVNLEGKRILVLGGGKVAARKVRKLMPFGGKITVIAPRPEPELEAAAGVAVRKHPFRLTDLWPRPAMVIAATDDRQVNARAARLCRKLRIPVNVADNGPESTFLFPALVNQGNFSAGISTGGASPTAAVYFKERLEELIPERLEEILSYLEEKRARLKTALPDQSARAAALRELLDACLELGRPPKAGEEPDISFRGGVTLVGAGCGKADLITLRGLRAIQRCQAVVYDDLIDPKLLEAAPETARRIYMGKRGGVAGATQAQINEQLIALAREGLRVVRLKGGDPYLFGRGGEEMLALTQAGIPCREIPGIPSAIGIPAEAGIPVTHRGLSRGLHILTGHTADAAGGLPGGLREMAGLPGTLVFLMGLGSLEKIAGELMAGGKDAATPAAVISGGNSPHPACVRGNLANISERVQEAGVQSPAVILVGEVAALQLGGGPLAGVRVGITGTEAVAEKQKRLLEALGAETEWISRWEIQPRPAWREPEAQGWLVFTSANGVGVFFGSRNPGDWKHRKFAVIGPATGQALASRGIQAALCPPEYTGEALAQAIAQAAQPGEPVTLLRSSQGGSALPRLLEAAGHPVTDVPLYDPVPAGTLGETEGLDYLTFASAGGAAQFFDRGGTVAPGVKCVCIGKTTAEALRGHISGPLCIAKEATVESMVEAIAADR